MYSQVVFGWETASILSLTHDFMERNYRNYKNE